MIPVRPIVEAVEAALAATVLASLAYAVLRLCRKHPVEAGIALFLAMLGSFALMAIDTGLHGVSP